MVRDAVAVAVAARDRDTMHNASRDIKVSKPDLGWILPPFIFIIHIDARTQKPTKFHMRVRNNQPFTVELCSYA